jgi:O-antigen/teichoic acid export membrane protein
MNWRKIFLKNASANVVRGMATAAVALLLPPFLTRLLSPDRFAAWSLLLQIAAYLNYLDFGLQTAVARYVAHANERADLEKRDRIIASAFLLLCGVGLLVLSGTILAAWQLPNFYHQIPAGLMGDFRLALLVVGFSLAVALPASVFTGILVGFHRNEFPAIAIGGSRIAAAISIIVLASRSDRLLWFALALAAWQFAGYVFQSWASGKLLGRIMISLGRATRESVREVALYCATLSAWNAGALLVSGLDLILVGYLDFKALGPYSVATTLVTFVAGLNGAIFGAMISPAAVFQARSERARLGSMVLRSTRMGIYLTVLIGLPLITFGGTILSHWVRADYVAPALPVLQILTAANIIRLAANPYSVAVIGTAQQRLVYISPLVEGISNLGVSIAFGLRFGALGVALGTLVGSVIGLLWTIFYSVPRTRDIGMTLREYAVSAVLRGFVTMLPAFAAVGIAGTYSSGTRTFVVLLGLLVSSGLILSREVLARPASAA